VGRSCRYQGWSDKLSSLFPLSRLPSKLPPSPLVHQALIGTAVNVFYHQKYSAEYLPHSRHISFIIKFLNSVANLNRPLTMWFPIRVHLSMTETRLSSLFLGGTFALHTTVRHCVPRLTFSRVVFSLLMAQPFAGYSVPCLWRCTGPGEHRREGVKRADTSPLTS
jgi:hypothetical protein